MFKVCSFTNIEDLLEMPHSLDSQESFEDGLVSVSQFPVFHKLLKTINGDENLKNQLALILLNQEYDQLRFNFSQIPQNTWTFNHEIRNFYQEYISKETSEPVLKRPKH